MADLIRNTKEKKILMTHLISLHFIFFLGIWKKGIILFRLETHYSRHQADIFFFYFGSLSPDLSLLCVMCSRLSYM